MKKGQAIDQRARRSADLAHAEALKCRARLDILEKRMEALSLCYEVSSAEHSGSSC